MSQEQVVNWECFCGKRCAVLTTKESNNTTFGLLRERMEIGRFRAGELNNNIPTSRSSQLKQRFRLRRYLAGCFFKDNDNTTTNDDFQPLDHGHDDVHEQVVDVVVPDNDQPTGGMNLEEALAAERQMMVSPGRVSLMRLLEETASEEVEDCCCNNKEEGGDGVCCVCMGRKKGAALIPCGHTFCRVCPREVWLNRGTCPLCNRSILDVLDIF